MTTVTVSYTEHEVIACKGVVQEKTEILFIYIIYHHSTDVEFGSKDFRAGYSRLKCTKFTFGWGSTPDPAGGDALI